MSVNLIKPLLIAVSLAYTTAGFGQTPVFEDTAASYFNEIKTASGFHQELWDLDLYAPMLLVKPETREVYANFPDSSGLKNGNVYTGKLPKSVNISNTSLNWNGRNWAMVMLPLPENKNDRINLLAHELFHRAQNGLGFKAYNPENNHLDKKEGRIYLRLELEALKKAVLSETPAEIKTHITNALIFRKYRYGLYPGADSTENLLEFNEGIAEYTGVMFSGRSKAEMQDHFISDIKRFLANPTYVRSFAYHTTPVYGYLLSETRRDWNKNIAKQVSLSEYFVKVFDVRLPENLKKAAENTFSKYGGDKITTEETAREEKVRKRTEEYISKFIKRSHLDLRLEKMNMSFDFRTIMPLEDKGTVYPTIRVTDNWGILEAENGALISPNWDRITVSVPLKFEKQKISGDGWVLELKEEYFIEQDRVSGNFLLKKK